jgi:hypothetical protein
MRTLCLALLAVGLAGTTAAADDIYANQSDPGKVNRITKGVKEIDVGTLAILSSDTENGETVTRVSTDTSASFGFFLNNNLSVGASVLFAYDSNGGGANSKQFGATANASFSVALGTGLFFRPGLSVGFLKGSRETPLSATMIQKDDQIGLIARLSFTAAYFISRRNALQAGPQLNIVAGTVTPMGAEGQSFTRVAGGFAVGWGYFF